jgi:hypothetical protein
MKINLRGFDFDLPCLEKGKRYDFKAQNGDDAAVLTIDLSAKTISLFTKRQTHLESIKLFFSTTWFQMKHYSGKRFLSRSNSFSHGTRATANEMDMSLAFYEEKVSQECVQDLVDVYYRLLVV